MISSNQAMHIEAIVSLLRRDYIGFDVPLNLETLENSIKKLGGRIVVLDMEIILQNILLMVYVI